MTLTACCLRSFPSLLQQKYKSDKDYDEKNKGPKNNDPKDNDPKDYDPKDKDEYNRCVA